MKEYRLYGDGKRDNTATLQELLDKKGRLVLVRGEYLTGPLTVSSDTEIVFEEGASLLFNPAFELYKPVYTRWEGVRCWCMHPCLYIKDARNVTIKGNGTIDGSGQIWWDTAHMRRNAGDGPQTEIEKMFASLNPGYEDQPGGGGGRQVQFLRPPLIQIDSSSEVTIEGLKVQNSPFWTIHPLFSDHVTLKNLEIFNPADAPNTDGIDIESCTDVVVDSCGSETAAGISDVEVSDCTFDGTDRGIRIKSRRGRGGVLHDLSFRNITMKDNLCPLVVNMYYKCGHPDATCFSLESQPVTDETPRLYNLEVINCRSYNSRSSAGMLVGLPESRLTNVTVKDCYFSVASENLRPVSESDMYLGLPEIEDRGIRIRFTDNLTLENVHVEGVSREIVQED